MSAEARLRLGPFELDRARRELRRNGLLVPLGSRAFDILAVLASANGGLVAKDELLSRVWPDTTVEESNLHVQVSTLRKVLGHDAGLRLITVPGRGYQIISSGLASAGSLVPSIDTASIVVLPFADLSEGHSQQYFADGVVEEVITTLTRIRSLFVIARDSSFTFRGRGEDAGAIGRELGVRYVLSGSLRRDGRRVRLTGKLADTRTAAYIWADRFDGDVRDIFALQDELSSRIVGAVAPALEREEIRRVSDKPTENLAAYDHYLRGLAHFYAAGPTGTSEALSMLHRAMALDPRFPSPFGLAVSCYLSRQSNHLMGDEAAERAEAMRLCRHIDRLDRDDAISLAQCGLGFAAMSGEVGAGIAMIDRALSLYPNFATALIASGWARTYAGDYDTALEHLSRAMMLSPRDPFMFALEGAAATAHFFAGRYKEAAEFVDRSLRERSNAHWALRIAAAANALLQRSMEAAEAVARLRAIDPNLSLKNIASRAGPYRPDAMKRLTEGLKAAGLD